MTIHRGAARAALDAARAALLDAWAVLMPTECSGCGSPDRALCALCAAALRGSPAPAARDALTVWSTLTYTDVVGRVLVAYKDGGRTDAAPALAAALTAAVAAALAAAELGDGPAVDLVTVPSSRRAWRARGFHPVDLLLRRGGLRPVRLLRQRGTVADQVGLGREQRLDNRRDALVATRTLVGRRILLVDDIVTTGATLLDARRALVAAGGEVIGAATVAHTPRYQPVDTRSRETD
jgi:predicted amidophosphoribosyltransferase